ncbi:phage baseplate assembly protein V [Chitinispirillales bacterium ANBcel5]|uniref:phage baseplate assembly protein V n=1 Tax=Cellulosispirillum alkaliphilum TaxID=3039283 RepID=UPI002A5196D1|nr:phage baseplate assembly protein V [Chitinispirillales bacterium ANBcel5]
MNQIAVLPNLQLELNGKLIDPQTARKVSSIVVRQALYLPTAALITFTEPPDSFYENLQTEPATELIIKCDGDQIFKGTTAAVEYTNQPFSGEVVTLRAYDSLYKMRKKQKCRSHSNLTCSDIIAEIAAEYTILVNAEKSGPHFPYIIQYQQSDLDFITSISQRTGFYFYLKNETLEFFLPELKEEPKILTRGKNLLECTIECNGTKSYDSFETFGWNPFRVSEHKGRAENSPSSSDIARNFSNLKEDAPSLATYHIPLFDNEHADSLSNSIGNRSQGTEVTITGVAEGDPELFPGSAIKIEGVQKMFSATHILTEVLHQIDVHSGFITKFSTEPPELVSNEVGPVATLANVLSVDDPENLGRVKVSFPTCNNVQSDWLTVLFPAAGSDKGIVALPDVGDKVLVLLINNDLSFGIVLGGLFGVDRDSPGWGVVNGAVKNYIVKTKDGQSIMLNDAEESIVVKNKEGSFYELAPRQVTFHSKRDLLIEAPGSKITIRGNSINFERG